MDNRVHGMTKGQPSPTTEPDWDSEIAPGGLGLRPFKPLALAVASGANYVARGFSGDPNGLADMIVEGLRWSGFAFIEILSPCITFRPEQAHWKKQVRHGALAPRPSARLPPRWRSATTASALAFCSAVSAPRPRPLPSRKFRLLRAGVTTGRIDANACQPCVDFVQFDLGQSGTRLWSITNL